MNVSTCDLMCFPTNGLEVFVMATGKEDKAKGAANKAAG